MVLAITGKAATWDETSEISGRSKNGSQHLTRSGRLEAFPKTLFGRFSVLRQCSPHNPLQAEDIPLKESDRKNGRLPVRGERLLNLYIFGLRFCGELVEPFVVSDSS